MPFIQISYYKMNESTIKVTSISNEAVCTLVNKTYPWCYHGENERDFRLTLKRT